MIDTGRRQAVATRAFSTGQAAYQQQSVTTASGGQLVVMMFDRAIQAVDTSTVALDEKRRGYVGVVHEELTKAQTIIEELSLSLDRDRGGLIADHLGSIYNYLLHELVMANITKDAGGLGAIRSHLVDLRDAFASATAESGSP